MGTGEEKAEDEPHANLLDSVITSFPADASMGMGGQKMLVGCFHICCIHFLL